VDSAPPARFRRASRRRRILPVPDLDLANTFMTSNDPNPDWFRGWRFFTFG
jgi:hypothetical protein